MKTITLLLVISLAACVGSQPAFHDVGRREAVRLGAVYTRWLTERPRKLDTMDVKSDALSKEARRWLSRR